MTADDWLAWLGALAVLAVGPALLCAILVAVVFGYLP